MAKQRRSNEFDLLDLIEQEEVKDNPETCQHRKEAETFTIWPGESFERCTWTCLHCGRIKGRMPYMSHKVPG